MEKLKGFCYCCYHFGWPPLNYRLSSTEGMEYRRRILEITARIQFKYQFVYSAPLLWPVQYHSLGGSSYWSGFDLVDERFIVLSLYTFNCCLLARWRVSWLLLLTDHSTRNSIDWQFSRTWGYCQCQVMAKKTIFLMSQKVSTYYWILLLVGSVRFGRWFS